MDQVVDQERDAIIAVIEGESLAFFSRDFDRWASCWVQASHVRRLVSMPGGQVDYHEGWDAEAAIVTRIMEQFPEPNPAAALRMRRENMTMRVTDKMAWVSFDQYGADTGDPFDAVGLSHQVRILEKHDGQWKIAMIASGETSIGYFAFPAVRVDRTASILWMNDAARASLPDHPALMESSGRLRARNRTEDKQLRAALHQVDRLTPMDIRKAAFGKERSRRAQPLVLGSGDSDAPHICWIAAQDGMLVVTFGDRESEAERLTEAEPVFGLSPAQMRLAALIVDGNDLSQSAKALGITVNTARTQLKRMFDKTGVRSQAALVRVLLSVGSPTG